MLIPRGAGCVSTYPSAQADLIQGAGGGWTLCMPGMLRTPKPFALNPTPCWLVLLPGLVGLVMPAAANFAAHHSRGGHVDHLARHEAPSAVQRTRRSSVVGHL